MTVHNPGPDADEIALLVVAVCTLTGDDPIDVVTSKRNTRSRAYAFRALWNRYPHVKQTTIAKLLGSPSDDNSKYFLRRAHDAKWWKHEIFDAVCGKQGAVPTVLPSTKHQDDWKQQYADRSLSGPPKHFPVRTDRFYGNSQPRYGR